MFLYSYVDQRHLLGCVWEMENFPFHTRNSSGGVSKLILSWLVSFSVASGVRHDFGKSCYIGLILLLTLMTLVYRVCWCSLCIPGNLANSRRARRSPKLTRSWKDFQFCIWWFTCGLATWLNFFEQSSV